MSEVKFGFKELYKLNKADLYGQAERILGIEERDGYSRHELIGFLEASSMIKEWEEERIAEVASEFVDWLNQPRK